MNKKNNVVKLPEKKKREVGLIETGTIGGLEYKIFKRGNIHLTDGVHTFRKDCKNFIAELKKLDFKKLDQWSEFEISGAGDTDPLIITKSDDVCFSLGNKAPKLIIELMQILNKV